MITPEEIQKKEFSHGMRGYREDEVDAFLNRITADLEALLAENASLRQNADQLAQENAHYRESESAMFRTLESAKSLMAEISASAEKRAEIVMKHAELDAERIRREARESVESMTEEAAALSRRWTLFGARFRNLLETELERFDSIAADLMDDGPARGAVGGAFGDAQPGLGMSTNPAPGAKRRPKPGATAVRGIPLAGESPGKTTRKF